MVTPFPDKNRFCIVMWSMGNESAYGCNFEKALEWTKNFDSDRITQYESARYRNYDETYDYSNLDVYSRMYPALSILSSSMSNRMVTPFPDKATAHFIVILNHLEIIFKKQQRTWL